MTEPRLMQLDHTVAVVLGGTEGDRIICAPCNLSMGAALGNRLRVPSAGIPHAGRSSRASLVPRVVTAAIFERRGTDIGRYNP